MAIKRLTKSTYHSTHQRDPTICILGSICFTFNTFVEGNRINIIYFIGHLHDLCLLQMFVCWPIIPYYTWLLLHEGNYMEGR